MKKLIIVSVALISFSRIEAQGTSGQIKAQIRQILLLKTYISYLEKGYAIAKKGLTTIGDIKNGDLHLHINNFDSYKAVNPTIKKYAKVADVLSLQLHVFRVYKQTTAAINSSQLFNPGEVAYVSDVFSNLLEQCANNIEELTSLTTSGQYEMKDDERMERIDALEKDMQDKYAFAMDFAQGAQVMALQKNKTQHEVVTSRFLTNIKNP